MFQLSQESMSLQGGGTKWRLPVQARVSAWIQTVVQAELVACFRYCFSSQKGHIQDPLRNGDECEHHKKGRCKFWHAPGTAKVCLLGAALMHAAASMCVTPTTTDLNGLLGRSNAAYVVPNASAVPLKSCFMPAHRTGRRIRHPDVEFLP